MTLAQTADPSEEQEVPPVGELRLLQDVADVSRCRGFRDEELLRDFLVAVTAPHDHSEDVEFAIGETELAEITVRDSAAQQRHHPLRLSNRLTHLKHDQESVDTADQRKHTCSQPEHL